MKTPEQVANEITAKYDSEEHYFGDELEMVHAAVVDAIRSDRAALVQEFEGRKGAIFSDGMKLDNQIWVNTGLYLAQDITRGVQEDELEGPEIDAVEQVAVGLGRAQAPHVPWGQLAPEVKLGLRMRARRVLGMI